MAPPKQKKSKDVAEQILADVRTAAARRIDDRKIFEPDLDDVCFTHVVNSPHFAAHPLVPLLLRCLLLRRVRTHDAEGAANGRAPGDATVPLGKRLSREPVDADLVAALMATLSPRDGSAAAVNDTFRAWFALIDVDASGSLSFGELGRFVRLLVTGRRLSASRAEDRFNMGLASAGAAGGGSLPPDGVPLVAQVAEVSVDDEVEDVVASCMQLYARVDEDSFVQLCGHWGLGNLMWSEA